MNQRGSIEKKDPPSWLRAMGKRDLPRELKIGEVGYTHVKTFKHDFFAATGLYSATDERKIVLKIGRQSSLFGIPMRWIGRALRRRESRMLKKSQHLDGVPTFIGNWDDTGLAHDFIEGTPLKKGASVPADFFHRLDALIREIHALDMAYVDLEKRENILLGDDGRPWLFDFQISWDRSGWFLTRWILRVLQRSDHYHLLKHWRRARPDQLSDAQRRDAERPPLWIAWHRAIFRPLIRLRRIVLTWLGARSDSKGRSPG